MLSKSIKEAVEYASCHLDLHQEDKIYFENILLAHFGLAEPTEEEIDCEHIKSLELPDEIISNLISSLMEEKGLEERDAFLQAHFVMGLLSPLPSTVNETCQKLYNVSPKEATEYLYNLSIANGYIAKSKVDKNMVWTQKYDNGPELEISINLSKPEKSNEEIAKLLSAPPAPAYPKCPLCKENLGFAGNFKKDPRENIRFIPLSLNGNETWYMQYSPYVYFDHHSILFYEKHVPMEINRRIVACLLSFVDLFPHFFIGSNSDLPIVGGSILNHEHFQGGAHLLPIFFAPNKFNVLSNEKVKLSVVDFYDTALRIEGEDREAVLALADKIILKWRKFNAPEVDIISSSNDEQHNTCTPFARKVGEKYEVILVLRNNRTSEEFPDGIFHAHPEYHNIKKEGIGLIEAAGLFILPARLLRQIDEVEDVLNNDFTKKEYVEKYPDLENFGDMIDTMRKENISSKEYVGRVCQGILRDVAVFKEDEKGQAAFSKFLEEVK